MRVSPAHGHGSIMISEEPPPASQRQTQAVGSSLSKQKIHDLILQVRLLRTAAQQFPYNVEVGCGSIASDHIS